jgi:serine kinase of HPr protein (carbohydrate metabolism regulator)
LNVPSRSALGFVHATALIVGERGVLVRGPSGSGKTSFSLALMTEARRDGLFARLIGDDRVDLSEVSERIIARPHPAIAGLVEQRWRGVVPAAVEAAGVIRLVVDLVEHSPPRVPPEDEDVLLGTVSLPRLVLPARPGPVACALVLAALAPRFIAY